MYSVITGKHFTGVFAESVRGSTKGNCVSGPDNSWDIPNFSAQADNALFGKSLTVQPKAVLFLPCLKI